MKKHSIWLILTVVIAVLCPPLAAAVVNGQEPSAYSTSASRSTATSPVTTLPSEATSPVTNLLSQATSPQPQPLLNCKYYVGKDFMASVSAAQNDNIPTAGSVAGGIVPHHLLAGKMIAAFFKTLSESNPDTLIIIAPNHRRIGHNSLNTSTLDWSTPFGTLKTDSDLTNRLISRLNASQSNSVMEEEHSISSLVPYIKYYMPRTKIVPFLLHGNYPPDKASELGRQLSEELSDTSENAAIIASVDFSHYLDAEEADKMDEKTLAAIKAFDLKSISLMGNDNLDSPPSIIALLSAMTETGANVPEVTGHDNSADITGKGVDYTTSYFTLLFRRPSQ